MKVLTLTHNFVRYEGDYAGSFLFALLREFSHFGFSQIVLTPHNEGAKRFEVLSGIKIFRFPYAAEEREKLVYHGNMHELITENPLKIFLFWVLLGKYFFHGLRIVREQKIDLIHAHWWIPSGLVGYFISILTGRNLIVTCHGTDVALIQKKRFLQPLAKLVLRKAKAITVVSSYLRKILVERIGLPKGNISVIPMPFEFPNLPVPPKRRRGEKNILCVARLTSQKRIDVLIDAVFQLNQEMEIKLIIIGDGPERENLRKHISERGLEGIAEMRGFIPRDELPNYYRECDLFVLPSINEGFGLTLAEAMLNRRPVIGADSGGIPDLIEDGRTGLLFQKGDSGKLAEAMRKILKDDRFAQQIAENGYQYVKGNLSSERIGEKMFAVYKDALKEKKVEGKRDY